MRCGKACSGPYWPGSHKSGLVVAVGVLSISESRPSSENRCLSRKIHTHLHKDTVKCLNPTPAHIVDVMLMLICCH